MTFETYYPAPFGVYNEMRAKKMAIGDNYYNGSQYCWSGTCSNLINATTNLVVEGNVGIGTATPAPNFKFQVLGEGASLGHVAKFSSAAPTENTYVALENYNTDYGGAHYTLWYLASESKGNFAVHQPSVGDRLVITQSGNVGIGTTDPGHKFHVVNSAGNAAAIVSSSYSDGRAALELRANGAGSPFIDFTTGSTDDSGGGIPDYSTRLLRYGGVNASFEFRQTGTGGFVFSGGNVGIGTANPNHKLEISGGSSYGLMGLRGTSFDIMWYNPADAFGNYKWDLTYRGNIVGEENDLVLFKGPGSSPTKTMIFDYQTGYVGIATDPGWLLHVNGAAAKPGGGSWTDSSDIRLKKNVKPIENALDKMLALEGISFEWDEPERAKLLPGEQIGMIAQEVEKVFPQWVGTDAKGYKDLTFRGFEALVVETIRKLKAENDGLKARIEALEARMTGND